MTKVIRAIEKVIRPVAHLEILHQGLHQLTLRAMADDEHPSAEIAAQSEVHNSARLEHIQTISENRWQVCANAMHAAHFRDETRRVAHHAILDVHLCSIGE